jgi:TetR/AcrR family transcriptional regulator
MQSSPKSPIKGRRTPGRPAASDVRDARELLLSAATELFASQGVAATTFAMIAARAGLTPAMLHYYFKDRNQLLDAVVDERLLRVVSKVWDPVQPGPSAADTVRGIVARLLDGIGEMPWIPSTWMREVLNEGGLLREKMLRRLPLEKVRSVAAAIAQGQSQRGYNADLDPVLFVFSMLGLVMLHMATLTFWAEIFHRKHPTKLAVQRHITGLLLHGLCHSPAATPAKARGGKKPSTRQRV